jgi:hypothetical protein
MDEIEPPEGRRTRSRSRFHYIEDDNILYKLIYVIVNEMKDYEHLYLKKLFHELNPVCATTGDYLYMANLYCIPRTAVFQMKLRSIRSITN